MVSLDTHLPDEDATLALGRALAACLEAGTIVFLHGDLGMGKTTLVRGVLRGLGWSGRVKSPTYALVEVYAISRLDLHHFDFYRFQDPREWNDAGFRESFNEGTVSLVEWPEKARGTLPPADLEITLTSSGSGRNASLRATSPRGTQLVQCLRNPSPSTSPPG